MRFTFNNVIKTTGEYYMQPRLLKEFIDITEKDHESSQRLLRSLASSSYIPWVRDISTIIETQDTYLTQEFKVDLPIFAFQIGYNEIHGLLDTLDRYFAAWEQAIKENAGQGVTAFLEAVDPIVDAMGEHLNALITKRKEQIANKTHLPLVELKESLVALEKNVAEIDALMASMPAPVEKSQDIHHLLWQQMHKIQANNHRSLAKNMAFLERTAKEDLDGVIKKYRNQVNKVSETYNQLVDIEAGDDVQLKEEEMTQSADVLAMQQERQAQRAEVSSFDSTRQKPDVEIESLVELMKAENISPASSSRNTPPNDSELASAFADSSDASDAGESAMRVVLATSSSDVSPESSPKTKKHAMEEIKEIPAESLRRNSLFGKTAQLAASSAHADAAGNVASTNTVVHADAASNPVVSNIVRTIARVS